MEKTKIAICMEDEEYRTRFVRCVMNHYKELFEIYVMNHAKDLTEDEKNQFGVIITGDGKEIEKNKVKESVLLVLMDEQNKEAALQENVFYTQKYQEVYKIMQDVEKAIAEKNCFTCTQTARTEIHQIGVFSLGREAMQIPFAALLAEILGEKHRVLVMDIQPFSGLAMEIETEDILGMEDLMSVATTQNYTENRIAGSIGHEQKWDFIYPAKNVSCLAEVNGELYQKILDLLQTQKHYEKVIINFGTVCTGMIELMENCQQIYMLTESKEDKNWREKDFIEQIHFHGKENLLQKINWVEMPIGFLREKSWRQQAKNWLWSELGDFVREQFWMENRDGTSV
ncbi:MAG: hypothetical protein IJO60_00485 [Agathobacter sp.]|nr:hypothetical protein [Agathobacter sp.]